MCFIYMGDTQLKRLFGSRLHCFDNVDGGMSYLAVTSCPETELTIKHVRSSVEEEGVYVQDIHSLLVTDMREGFTYSSKDVYRCNNPDSTDDAQLLVWNKKLLSDSQVNASAISRLLSSGIISELVTDQHKQTS